MLTSIGLNQGGFDRLMKMILLMLCALCLGFSSSCATSRGDEVIYKHMSMVEFPTNPQEAVERYPNDDFMLLLSIWSGNHLVSRPRIWLRSGVFKSVNPSSDPDDLWDVIVMVERVGEYIQVVGTFVSREFEAHFELRLDPEKRVPSVKMDDPRFDVSAVVYVIKDGI